MKKIKTNIIIAFTLVGFLAIFFYVYSLKKVESISIGGQIFSVEVVKDKDEMEKGLGRKESICSNCAMLFDFSKPGRYAFWMKEMRFALDIIWLMDNKIVHIEKNVQPTSNETLNPNVQADQVLEMNAGVVDKLKLEEGDIIK